MYNEGAGAAIAGGSLTAGSLAFTGVSVLSLAVLALTLLLMGAVLVRLATIEWREQILGDESVDHFAVLAAAVAATSDRED